jgi:O-methyltransferase
MKNLINKTASKFGYRIINERKRHEDMFLESDFSKIFEFSSPYTMTGVERLFALYSCVTYLIESHIPGSFVDCGVWKGGSVMAMIGRLQQLTVADREIYLFDLFAQPDLSGHLYWEGIEMSEVKKNICRLSYPEERLHFVSGDIGETSSAQDPEKIALLRLDMDEYKPTKIALENFDPRIQVGGVVMIDDYGSHPEGARKAVDEHLSRMKCRPFLHRVDHGARMWIKS